MKYAIFDLDGCISDDRWRRDLMQKVKWDDYHKCLSEDGPINMDIVADCVERGLQILFVTARPNKYRNITNEWLIEHLPISYERWSLYMRPDGNEMKSPELKKHLIDNSGIGWTNIAEAYDDRADVLQMYADREIPSWTLCANREQTGAPAILKAGAKTFEERGKVYGKNYVTFGHVGKALWPDGVKLETPEDFIRHGILIQCLSKLTRYANNPKGHKDSAHDLMVYAAMLEEVTE